MSRIDGRAADELRPWIITPDFLRHPAGSVLIACGNTREIAAATCENKVPQWMKNQKVPGGWLTCEYGMLPSATGERKKERRTHGVLRSFLFRNDLFYVLLDLFSCDGNISAAFDADHADIGADTKNLHAVLAAGVLFFHFEDVPDVEFLDLHTNLLYAGSAWANCER